MSLEIAIQNLADAINNLASRSGQPLDREKTIAILSSKEVPTRTIIEPAPAPIDAKSAVAEAKAKAEAAKVQAEAAKVAAELEATDAPTLSYETDVRPALTKYMQSKGKPAGLALMAKYGAKNGTEIKAADYAALLADIAAG